MLTGERDNIQIFPRVRNKIWCASKKNRIWVIISLLFDTTSDYVTLPVTHSS